MSLGLCKQHQMQNLFAKFLGDALKYLNIRVRLELFASNPPKKLSPKDVLVWTI
jgi:hypothetical protein